MSVIIYGKDGFIGKTLMTRELPTGIYSFDAPSSNVLFDEMYDWCAAKTIGDFQHLLARVRKTGEYLVFPSSATVYNKNTAYARTKAAVEELYLGSGVDALGLRISAGYGPNESHKGPFASVVYQWTKAMMNGERPVIYGDGTQTRDFVFQEDIADEIQRLAWKGVTGLHDIGSGTNTSFNEVVETINQVIGTSLEPIYVEKPKHYVQSTPVKGVQNSKSLEYGIQRIRDALLLERTV